MSKKILAFVLALVLVCSLIPAVAAAETSATISFSDLANRISVSTTQQVWQQNGITVTNDKAASSSNVNETYYNPIRCYQNSNVTIEYPGMTKIVVTCNDYKDYATPLVNTVGSAIATADGDVVTIELASAVNTFVIENLTAQVRINEITVYGGGEVAPTQPTEPEATEAPVVVPTDPKEIVEAAYALEAGASLPYTATLTGTITEITEEYSAQHKNITIIIVVEGCEDMPIKCYRLKGTGVDQIAVGDSVTVTGTIVNYLHSSGDSEVEFTNGCTLDSWTSGGSTTPSEPEETQPVTPGEITEISVADAVALGEEMEHGQYTAEQYKVTGIIAEINSTQYGNMYITDGNGNYLYIYGTYNADGTVAYPDMEVKPVAGDIVTIQGAIGNYSKAAQIKDGWIIEHTVGEPPVTEPVEEPDAVLDFSTTDNRVSQTTAQQVWQQNGITVTNDKASSTTNIIDSSNPVRFYKNSKVTIEAAGMTKIVIACNNLTYADALVASISAASGVTVIQNMSDVTIEFAEAVDSFVIEALSGGQVRVDSIGVYFASEEIVGDMNGDAVINNDDVVALLWNSLFPLEYPLEVNGDLNGDAEVNNDDVVALLWHSLFPDEYPL